MLESGAGVLLGGGPSQRPFVECAVNLRDQHSAVEEYFPLQAIAAEELAKRETEVRQQQ
jgi:hypothetical protein